MYMKTTYVMTDETIELLKDAEKKTGRDAMDLIFLAMQMLVDDFQTIRNELGPVEYQKRIDEDTGMPIPKYKVRVKMMKLVNRLYQDMRCGFLMSISLLIALAITKYHKMIIAYYNAKYREEGEEDFYPSGNYAHLEKRIENSTEMTIWWGVPPNIKEILTT